MRLTLCVALLNVPQQESSLLLQLTQPNTHIHTISRPTLCMAYMCLQYSSLYRWRNSSSCSTMSLIFSASGQGYSLNQREDSFWNLCTQRGNSGMVNYKVVTKQLYIKVKFVSHSWLISIPKIIILSPPLLLTHIHRAAKWLPYSSEPPWP